MIPFKTSDSSNLLDFYNSTTPRVYLICINQVYIFFFKIQSPKSKLETEHACLFLTKSPKATHMENPFIYRVNIKKNFSSSSHSQLFNIIPSPFTTTQWRRQKYQRRNGFCFNKRLCCSTLLHVSIEFFYRSLLCSVYRPNSVHWRRASDQQWRKHDWSRNCLYSTSRRTLCYLSSSLIADRHSFHLY